MTSNERRKAAREAVRRCRERKAAEARGEPGPPRLQQGRRSRKQKVETERAAKNPLATSALHDLERRIAARVHVQPGAVDARVAKLAEEAVDADPINRQAIHRELWQIGHEAKESSSARVSAMRLLDDLLPPDPPAEIAGEPTPTDARRAIRARFGDEAQPYEGGGGECPCCRVASAGAAGQAGGGTRVPFPLDHENR